MASITWEKAFTEPVVEGIVERTRLRKGERDTIVFDPGVRGFHVRIFASGTVNYGVQVRVLRKKYGFPGMLILQFAFDSGPDNPYLPHNHTEDSVVYTGTHDNDTTVGWYSSLLPEQRQRVLGYLGMPSEPMPWPLIESAYASVARQAIIPLQDALALGGEHRLNIPGTTEGNWRWRFDWKDFSPGLAERLAGLVQRYGR